MEGGRQDEQQSMLDDDEGYGDKYSKEGRSGEGGRGVTLNTGVRDRLASEIDPEDKSA